MEIYTDITFTSPEKDIKFWKQLLKGLCKHKRGAWLEEQFDQFGPQASALISRIMDECGRGNGEVVFDDWQCDGNHFETTISGGSVLLDLLPNIRALLDTCGVQDLVLDDPEEEY
jgi:hypothetical protein